MLKNFESLNSGHGGVQVDMQQWLWLNNSQKVAIENLVLSRVMLDTNTNFPRVILCLDCSLSRCDSESILEMYSHHI